MIIKKQEGSDQSVHSPESTFDQFMEDEERRRVYERESLSLEATELISGLMDQSSVTKTELAKKIGKSKAFLTQILSGRRNMTLHTFADLSFALGHRVELGLSETKGKVSTDAQLGRLASWAITNSFSTGHAETMKELLDELLPQIEEVALGKKNCAIHSKPERR